MYANNLINHVPQSASMTYSKKFILLIFYIYSGFYNSKGGCELRTLIFCQDKPRVTKKNKPAKILAAGVRNTFNLGMFLGPSENF